jgi:hypothetical protein
MICTLTAHLDSDILHNYSAVVAPHRLCLVGPRWGEEGGGCRGWWLGTAWNAGQSLRRSIQSDMGVAQPDVSAEGEGAVMACMQVCACSKQHAVCICCPKAMQMSIIGILCARHNHRLQRTPSTA